MINSDSLFEIPSANQTQPPRRILVAEDDSFYRRVLSTLLERHSYQVTMANDGIQALELAASPDAPRLVILDWVMPGLCGPEICQRLRLEPTERYQYILLLTAKDSTAEIVEGLEAGADDYLTKPFDCQELLARLLVGTRILSLQDALLDTKKELQYQATHDSLTGLWNRLAWNKLLNGEVERARRNSGSVAVLMIDIDRFKLINDQYGHFIGDAVLREVAQTIGACVRAYDVAGRYGGEEFIVVAQDLSGDALLEYADRLRRTVAGTPVCAGKSQIPTTVSIGVATSDVQQAQPADSLVRLADQALYAAKAQGRNCVVLQSPRTVTFVELTSQT